MGPSDRRGADKLRRGDVGQIRCNGLECQARMASRASALTLLVFLTDLDSSGVHQTSVSQEIFVLRPSTDLVLRLCFLSLRPVTILDSPEETLTEPGQVPGFARAWPPFSGFSLSLSQFHCGKKVRPASNADGLDTKSIEDGFFSFI